MKSNPPTTIVPRLGRSFVWLCASLLAATGPFVATGLAHVLEIDEVGEAVNPVVTYDGNPVTLDPSSTLFKDNWTIVLPTSFALNHPAVDLLLGEPENPAQINEILVGTQPTTLTWASDRPKPAGLPVIPNTITLSTDGTFTPTPGGPSQTFDVVLKDLTGTQVPDGWSTATLLGLAFGLLGAARIRAARG